MTKTAWVWIAVIAVPVLVIEKFWGSMTPDQRGTLVMTLAWVGLVGVVVGVIGKLLTGQ